MILNPRPFLFQRTVHIAKFGPSNFVVFFKLTCAVVNLGSEQAGENLQGMWNLGSHQMRVEGALDSSRILTDGAESQLYPNRCPLTAKLEGKHLDLLSLSSSPRQFPPGQV